MLERHSKINMADNQLGGISSKRTISDPSKVMYTKVAIKQSLDKMLEDSCG